MRDRLGHSTDSRKRIAKVVMGFGIGRLNLQSFLILNDCRIGLTFLVQYQAEIGVGDEVVPINAKRMMPQLLAVLPIRGLGASPHQEGRDHDQMRPRQESRAFSASARTDLPLPRST